MTYAITCQNPACQIRQAVRSASEQRRKKFCSLRCAGLVAGVKNFAGVDRQAAHAKSLAVRRAKWQIRLQAMTKAQVAKLAYQAGYKAGLRYARKWAA